jgi:ABC-2 type transport system permease protein
MAGARAIIREIVRKEFYQIRQDRRMLGVSIVAPVLQVLLLGYAATTDIKNSEMVVNDQDRTAESREFVRRFTASGHFVEVTSAATARELTVAIERGDARVGLVVPQGFGNDVLRRSPAAAQLVLDGADANSAAILLAYATQIGAAYSADILPVPLPAGGSGGPGRIVPEPRIWFNPDLLSAHFMVPGVVGLVLMLITMMLTALSIVKEKEAGTMEQLMVSPIRPYELVLGKLIPFVVIGFVDMTIALSLAHFWFRVPMLGSIPLLFGLSVLFILTTLGLGLFISTVARTQQQAMLISQFFFFMPFMFLSGFAFPVSNMPPVIQAVTYLIPLRYFLEIARAIFLKGAGITELWPQALALLAIGVSVLTLSTKRFRKTLE